MRDALHHQQQALLRNSHSVANTLWLWWTIGWAWRSKSNHSVMRSLGLILVAIFHIAMFMCAGIFSSKVALTDNAALALSNNCGSWPLEDIYLDSDNSTSESLLKQNAYLVNARKEIVNSLNYIQNCYGGDSKCTRYMKTALPNNKGYNVNGNAPCPFDDELCTTETVHIDTGMFNV